jgi:hypothetical protein
MEYIEVDVASGLGFLHPAFQGKGIDHQGHLRKSLFVPEQS